MHSRRGHRSRKIEPAYRRSALRNYDNEAKPLDYLDIRGDDEKVLKIQSIDFNIPANATAHHTDDYELTIHREENGRRYAPWLVVRRGQPFDITLLCNRPFNKETDDFCLVFELGDLPKVSRNTSVLIIMSDKDKPGCWGAKVKEVKEDSVTVTVFTPSKCFVGKWQFGIDSLQKANKERVFRYADKSPIYILFNAWCKEDSVYMEDETFRNEFVLNDVGKMYAGNHKQVCAKPWNFAQFEDFILDCVFYTLDLVKMPYRLRGDPVLMVRRISASANAQDDDGILEGNWSGDYHGGTPPIAWSGSEAIMSEFWRTLHPVKYGQCWVFSGIVTTMCRAVGIPARCVTNFSSAHDTDGSITIDDYWDISGSPLSDYCNDSIWNFHVWNDVWMARPDLPDGYGGWQAIDATPQETSEGVYCCGPASVKAIKEGLLQYPYDAGFIYAEVNADRVHWIKQADGTWRKNLEKSAIGRKISTKMPVGKTGPDKKLPDRDDVTLAYKYAEGSKEERESVKKACSSATTDVTYEEDIEDMAFNLEELDTVLIGEAFDVMLEIENKSDKQRNMCVTLSAAVTFYTGLEMNRLKIIHQKIAVEPKTKGSVSMKVEPNEYLRQLVELANIKISVMVNVEETGQSYAKNDDFRLIKPDLVINGPKEVVVGKQVLYDISFTNPLDVPLTKCQYQCEGPGLQRAKRVNIGNVAPGEKAVALVDMTPRRCGKNRQLVAVFHSAELVDVSGSLDITVKKE
ncbi:hemocyte protein-glutamine gamma-glutamyltransferase-like [Lineus longissimus]|uniref:hemocyte protein-glutamine gamma-glutamyltransferase-like n=1 Tax=Lineus longissimus TaxID=88925 RepID=UPI00315D697C